MTPAPDGPPHDEVDGGAPAVLSIGAIDAGYDGTAVLRGVSIDVPPAAVVALLGPNGAGKTTLLRCIAGLLDPSDGTIHLDGTDIAGLSPAQRRLHGLCLIPEGRGVFPTLTVRENLWVQCQRKDRADVVERVVEAFPALRDRLAQVAGSMSGGQQQMLALARCYTRKSRVLMIDEVSMGLAPIVIDEVYEALGALRRTGVAMLLVEQYVDRALALADHVYALSNGVARSLGPPSQVDRDDLHRRYLGTMADPVEA